MEKRTTTRKRAKNSVILGVSPETCPPASETLNPSQRPTKQAAGDDSISLGVLALLRVVVILTRIFAARNPPTIWGRSTLFLRGTPPILVGEFLEADRVSGSSEGEDFRWPRSLRKRDFASIRRLRNPSPDVSPGHIGPNQYHQGAGNHRKPTDIVGARSWTIHAACASSSNPPIRSTATMRRSAPISSSGVP